MPGTAIGIKFPSPTKTVFQAELTIRKKDGKYSLNPLQPYVAEEPNIVEELRKVLEAAVKKLNGE
jgi:hypothetical protein